MDITGTRHINCHSINISNFSSCNFCNGNNTYTSKTVNFRHRMNNHITDCHYKFNNHFFKYCNKNEYVAKEP